MTLSATATLAIRLTARQVNAADFGEDGTSIMNEAKGPTFTSGTGANSINLFWADERTLAAGASEVLNIHDASLTNALGNTVAIDTLKAIYVKNTSTALSLLIGGGTTPVGFFANASDILTVPPGGEVLLTAPNATGWAVTTNVNLKLEASAGSGNLIYDVAVFGVDA